MGFNDSDGRGGFADCGDSFSMESRLAIADGIQRDFPPLFHERQNNEEHSEQTEYEEIQFP